MLQVGRLPTCLPMGSLVLFPETPTKGCIWGEDRGDGAAISQAPHAFVTLITCRLFSAAILP